MPGSDTMFQDVATATMLLGHCRLDSLALLHEPTATHAPIPPRRSSPARTASHERRAHGGPMHFGQRLARMYITVVNYWHMKPPLDGGGLED